MNAIGTADQAIEWIVTQATPELRNNAIEFLEAWTYGDVSEWPEYSAWLSSL